MKEFFLQLSATSANLGPGFDAAGLALSLYLKLEAERADEFTIHATGRDAGVTGNVTDSLIVRTYRDVLHAAGKSVPPLALRIFSEIPLGMGCGSSATALLAGVVLADHFGSLNLGDAGIVDEASRREGHPDNVAACWYGGLTVSAMKCGRVQAASFPVDPRWQMLLVMQKASLATKKARALLPETYSKADAVFNVQRVALLTAAFAQRRLDLLATAMEDCMHQPYRLEACPLLQALLPLSGKEGVAGVALSGAGPSVLLVLDTDAAVDCILSAVREAAGDEVEIRDVRAAGGALKLINPRGGDTALNHPSLL